MMVERHYDDEALISLMESNRAGTDTHLPSCSVCSEKLKSVRTLAGTLRDRAVWDTRHVAEEPNRNTIATLRAFANRMADEDTHAEAYLRDLLDGPRDRWMAKLNLHPEYRTAGVVRKLIAAASRAVDTMPPDAVEMAALATEIADRLDPAEHASDAVSRLRGAAWREMAYALFYTGQFPAALQAVDHADAEFAQCVVDNYDRARAGIVKTLILRAYERLDGAQRVARSSAATFSEYEDVERCASANLAQAQVLVSRGDIPAAISILEEIENRLRDTDYVDTHARVLGNLGNCARRIGQWDRSIHHYDLSTHLFDALDNAAEAVRNRWNAAKVAMEAGRFLDAKRRLEVVVREMDMLGMTSASTMARLDVAELLLAEGRFAEVEEICRAAMQSFERAGLAFSQRAMTALAFIREAAQQRTASQELVRTVRNYLNRLPSEPQLLFAFPPQ